MFSRINHNKDDGQSEILAVLGGLVGIAAFLGLILGLWLGIKSVHRHQKMADAKNDVQIAQVRANNEIKLNQIRIQSQSQRVKVAQQEAEIRRAQAVGLREAQDEVAKTLTPLYVQFEMVDALKQIAQSGKNNTVVYVPSGANGIPLVSGVAGQPAVGSEFSR